MKRIDIVACFFVVLLGAFFASCTKENEYKKFFGDGELPYAGRPDSVIVHPGNGRIQLSVVLGNDPLVTKVKAYWNDKSDSLEVAVKRTLGKDTVNLMINNLKEGNYNFNVFTYDNKNHSSVVMNTSGIVYGASYQSSVVNRRLKDIGFSTDGYKLLLTWANPNIDDAGAELHYINANGVSKTMMVKPKEAITTLMDVKGNTEISYRTIFKPDSLSLDTYVPSGYIKVTVPVFERQLDKSKFNEFYLPTDAKSDYGWVMPNLWDERYDPNGFATTSGVPLWFTFDTGVSATPGRFKTWQANDRLYVKESVKRFEVWGSNAPNSDGSWGSWTKLMTCESVKPSGLPVGENSAADIAYAKAGEEFIFPSGLPKVRYFRFKLLENWGNSNFMTMEELTFWTHDR